MTLSSKMSEEGDFQETEEWRTLSKAIEMSILQKHLFLPKTCVRKWKGVTQEGQSARHNEFQSAQDQSKVRAFLGLIGYYYKFIPKYRPFPHLVRNDISKVQTKSTGPWSVKKKHS